jgi:hypothetical protein
MIDPLLSISFNLHAQRGTYALLLGSGVSRAASVPTGWEVTLDLVGKLAHIQNESCQGSETEWYTSKYGRDPDYSEVLSSIAPTSAAQQQLLKGYFEPSEQEREEGKKLPTAAHNAIADLVSSGHVRVVITTNFDRLLEAALEAKGIAPVVIASSDAAKGAPPLAHSKCTVIKVHGDYLDHRIKNSVEALAKYDRGMNRLLDQVLDEYGLVVCGWSGEYDAALRRCFERAKSRRYPMYWTGLSEPKGASKQLVDLQRAQFIRISNADSFFASLLEKINSLDEFERPHPLGIQAATSTLKKYLSEDKYRIQLRDFVMDQAQQLVLTIDPSFAAISGVTPNQKSAVELMKRLEAASEMLVHIFAIGSFYGSAEQARFFFDAFNLIVSKSEASGGYKGWIDLRRYPALLLIYSTGIAAVASENFAALNELSSRRSLVRHEDDKDAPAPVRIHVHSTIERDLAREIIPGMDRRYTPFNDYLLELLKSFLKRLIPSDTEYERAFDDFEYFWCLLHVDAKIQANATHIWAPYGAFCWRRRERRASWAKDQAKNAIDKSDVSWPPLRAGLFGGKIDRLKAAYETAQPILDAISSRMY